jgi:hypothetical protein
MVETNAMAKIIQKQPHPIPYYYGLLFRIYGGGNTYAYGK